MPPKLVILSIAAVLATGPAAAQQGLQRPAAALIGLPVYTSEGRLVGKITDLGRKGHGQGVLIAELERPLGLGPQTVAIPIDMFVQRPDRIELTISADQVNDRLAGVDRSGEQ
jgi:sporulation protein YlmC with PRC-barrel domain